MNCTKYRFLTISLITGIVILGVPVIVVRAGDKTRTDNYTSATIIEYHGKASQAKIETLQFITNQRTAKRNKIYYTISGEREIRFDNGKEAGGYKYGPFKMMRDLNTDELSTGEQGYMLPLRVINNVMGCDI